MYRYRDSSTPRQRACRGVDLGKARAARASSTRCRPGGVPAWPAWSAAPRTACSSSQLSPRSPQPRGPACPGQPVLFTVLFYAVGQAGRGELRIRTNPPAPRITINTRLPRSRSPGRDGRRRWRGPLGGSCWVVGTLGAARPARPARRRDANLRPFHTGCGFRAPALLSLLPPSRRRHGPRPTPQSAGRAVRWLGGAEVRRLRRGRF